MNPVLVWHGWFVGNERVESKWNCRAENHGKAELDFRGIVERGTFHDVGSTN